MIKEPLEKIENICDFYDDISISSGTLFLSMFDNGMDDNAGSINVQIITYP